jgi:undecaprenyl-diphosphatase
MEALFAAAAVSLGTAAAVALAVLAWPRPARQLVAEGPANPVESPAAPAETPASDDAVAAATIAPDAPSGVMLTIAIVILLITAVVVGVVAFLLRRDPATFGVDQQVEAWAGGVATPTSDGVLRTITHLGDTATVIGLGLALGGWFAWRRRCWTGLTFLAAVVAGQFVAAELVKAGVERARPILSQRADFSGTSFPSGHSTAATACYVGFALVLAAGRPVRTRAALIGAGAGLGVAVASSRVLLGVHWLSDALTGVALGSSVALLAHAAFARRPRWWRTARSEATARPSAATAATPAGRR